MRQHPSARALIVQRRARACPAQRVQQQGALQDDEQLVLTRTRLSSSSLTISLRRRPRPNNGSSSSNPEPSSPHRRCKHGPGPQPAQQERSRRAGWLAETSGSIAVCPAAESIAPFKPTRRTSGTATATSSVARALSHTGRAAAGPAAGPAATTQRAGGSSRPARVRKIRCRPA